MGMNSKERDWRVNKAFSQLYFVNTVTLKHEFKLNQDSF